MSFIVDEQKKIRLFVLRKDMYVHCFKVLQFTLISIIALDNKVKDISSQLLKRGFVFYSDRLFPVWFSLTGKNSIVESHEELLFFN